MPQDRTRKIAIAGVLSAIACLLGYTHWGFIPWFAGASLTVMHVPAIIGAVLEGPVVGLVIGLIFGLFSMVQAAVAPTGPVDVWFTNPLLSVLPRLFIGPITAVVWMSLRHTPVFGLIIAGVVGSLVNTVLVLGMIGVMGHLPWGALPPIALANGLPEAAVSALLTLAVVGAYRTLGTRRQGSDLS